MGMGEPLANFANLMRAIDIINAPWGVGLGARHITISTSGLAPQIRQLADQPLQVRLAISLHGATDEVRQQIMPVNRKYPLADAARRLRLLRRAKEAAASPSNTSSSRAVNDAPDARRRPRPRRASVGREGELHPLQHRRGPAWVRPSEARQDAFMAVLDRAGVPATIRREKGHDIAAACGQLRRQQNLPVKLDS